MTAAATTAVVGAGAIGVAFALLVADHGRDVTLVEQDPARHEEARTELRLRVETLVAHGVLRTSVEDILRRVRITALLADGAAGAGVVLECITERVGAKRSLVAAVAALVDDGTVPADVVVGSASSAITASETFAGSPLADRGLVTHPLNPPFAVPLVELVPSPRTAPDAVAVAERFFRSVGMSPITLRREIPGFVTNRLQAALLREAYLLVRDGVASVADVDTAVREGLGRRWAVAGPFDVADLNTRGGIAAHAERLGPAYGRIAEERGDEHPWSDPELVAEVAAELRRRRPLQRWESDTRARDEGILAVTSALRARREGPAPA